MSSDTVTTQPGSKAVGNGKIFAAVLVYALFASCWILLSDRLVGIIFSDPEKIILASIIKGWLFVLVTSLLLYGLMRRWVASDPAPAAAMADSRQLKRLLLLLVICILTLTVAGITHVYTNIKQREVTRLKAVANLKSRHIVDWLKERQGDAHFLRNSDLLASLYRHWQESGDTLSGKDLQTELEQFRRSQGFDAVTLLNPNGEKLWGSEKSPMAIPPMLQTAARLSATERQVRQIGPYLDPTGQRRLDFIAPLAAVSPLSPVVILHVDPENWFFPTLKIWPVPSVSGEALLFRRDGDQILYLNELRHQTDNKAMLKQPVSMKSLLAAKAVRGETVAGETTDGVDYRGIPVIGTVVAITGSDWFLVAKLDRSELYTKAIGETDWISFTGLLTLLMTVTAFYLLKQRQQLASAEALQQSQAERLRALNLLAAIVDSSNDAIFAKDLDGRFTLFNRAAAHFVGQPAEEVLGKDEYAIFPAETAEKLVNIGRKVLTEHCIHTQEEVLSMAIGERTCLTTKGPLRDADNRVIGLFGICRDITDRKQAELELRESESRFRALVEQSLAGIYIIQDNRFRYINPAFAAMFGYRKPRMLIDRVFVADLISPEHRKEVTENIRRLIEKEVASIMHYTFTALRRDGSPISVEAHGSGIDYQGSPAVIGLILDISARKAAEEALCQQADELYQRNLELERFNRASVGRELDMIALKQQINALSSQLGQNPPYPLDFLASSQAQARRENSE